MSVLFGFSKKESVSQDEAFAFAAAIVACIGLPVFCIVRNVKIKTENPTVIA